MMKMSDEIIILDGRINPLDYKSVLEVMNKFPNYYPVMILLGEIHAIKLS